MKKLYLALCMMVAAATLSAQNPTTYFMEGTPLRSQWNPAFTTERGYVNIPLIGGIQLGTDGNIALSDILYPTADGSLTTLLSGTVPAQVALDGLEEMNHLGLGVNMNLIGFGAYTKKRHHFWSFGLNLRAEADTGLPYGLFEFMKSGRSTRIQDLDLAVESYAELAFSYTFPIFKGLDLGLRGKVLFGLARASMHFDQFDAHLGADSWSAHAVGNMEFSGLVPSTKRLDDGRLVYDMGELVNDFKAPAGYGFGVDVGATFTPIKNLTVSASVNDIGFISWSKSANSIGTVDRELLFTGVETDGSGNAVQPEFDFEELQFDVQESKGLTKALRASVNVGGEYNFLDRRIGLGLFYQAKFREFDTRHNLTFSANFRPLKWLHLTGSYSFVNNEGGAVGLALNLCPRFISFFVGTDILLSKKTPQWLPINQGTMNLTFGLAVPIGK
ncbi:MAG: hypothetical protein E7137_07910 [Rikenellaceae bacterium]|nr:hypothetical protein [Rikenellaceae bacterium]